MEARPMSDVGSTAGGISETCDEVIERKYLRATLSLSDMQLRVGFYGLF